MPSSLPSDTPDPVPARRPATSGARSAHPGYVELHCHSGYSFLDGASHPEELVLRAKELGYPALALTDHNGLYGSMEFARQAKEAGLQPITGAELSLAPCFDDLAAEEEARLLARVAGQGRGVAGRGQGVAGRGRDVAGHGGVGPGRGAPAAINALIEPVSLLPSSRICPSLAS